MKKENTTLKKFKKVVRWFDFSGESFTFKYKDKDKLATILAGIIYLIFFLLALSYFISIFIPFHDKKIFDLQYYVMNSDQKEKIIFGNKTTAFAFGLTNENKNATYDIKDLFVIEAKFSYKLNGNDQKDKSKNLFPNQCKKEDFIKPDTNSSILENIEKFKCFDKDDLKASPEGIYTDNIFSYYTITVKSKYPNNKTYDNIIDEYLTKNDCKLQFYYTDIRLDLGNYDKPFSYIINSMFLQLNPSLIQKKNIFYMNYHLENDTRLFQLTIKDQVQRIETGLSRVEDYAEYKGINRTIRGYGNDNSYAKIYIRADNRKIIIKRKYQDLLEFYAEKSSLWLSVYWILGFLFALYNRENANHSISKRLFYFEGIKENKFNKFKELKELKELINKIKEKESKEQNNENQVSPYTTRNISENRRFNNNFIRRNTDSSLKIDIDKNKKDKHIKEKLINYESYNLFEMIGSQKLFFCKSKYFVSKINLINQAKNIIDDKLDIIYYIRKMILFEIINKIQLENKDVIDFLSRPIIYLNETKKINKKNKDNINDKATNTSIEIENIEEQPKIDEKMNMDPVQVLKEYVEDEAYKTAYKLNPDILIGKIMELLRNKNKTNAEKNLISYLKEQLEGIH